MHISRKYLLDMVYSTLDRCSAVGSYTGVWWALGRWLHTCYGMATS